MSPVLGAVVLACLTGATSAFVAYWMGRAAGEKNTRILLARYELMSRLNVDLAASLAVLKRRLGHLTPDEAAKFHDISNHYGKESA